MKLILNLDKIINSFLKRNLLDDLEEIKPFKWACFVNRFILPLILDLLITIQNRLLLIIKYTGHCYGVQQPGWVILHFPVCCLKGNCGCHFYYLEKMEGGWNYLMTLVKLRNTCLQEFSELNQ